MSIISFSSRRPFFFILAFVFISFCAGCCHHEDGALAKELIEAGIQLRNEEEIKVFIVADLIRGAAGMRETSDNRSNLEAVSIRLINEEDFDIISKMLFRKGVLFESGKRNISINSDNMNPPWEDDGLDYSPKHIYKHRIICVQIENFKIPPNADELKVNIGVYRSGLDGYGYSYFFQEKDGIWKYSKKILNWLS